MKGFAAPAGQMHLTEQASPAPAPEGAGSGSVGPPLRSWEEVPPLTASTAAGTLTGCADTWRVRRPRAYLDHVGIRRRPLLPALRRESRSLRSSLACTTTVVLAINQRTSDVFGIAQDEAVGRHAPDYYVRPEERRRLAEQVAHEGRADEPARRAAAARRRARSGPACSARRVVFGGEPAVLTVFNDISDQVAAERILKASEQRLAAQSDALTDAHRPLRRLERQLRRAAAQHPRSLGARRCTWSA